MVNTIELRKELSSLYQNLKSGEVDVETAKALVAASNSILKSASLEMEHSKMIDDKREIKFLATPPFGREK